MTVESDESDLISGHIVAAFQSPTWVAPIAQFIDKHCDIFEDVEENKLEYTPIHNAFKQLFDDLLTAHLSELAVTPEQFERFCQHGLTGSNELHRGLVEQLLSIDDFLVFKAMMVRRNADLTREALAASALAAAEAEQHQLKLDQLEAAQKCLEAELHLALALKMQLEQRLQLLQALNEMERLVQMIEASGVADAAQQGLEAANAAALPATVHVAPLDEPAAAAAGPEATEDELTALRRRLDRGIPPSSGAAAFGAPAQPQGPTEEERRARAEHLRRQRDEIRARKTREREAQLSAHQASGGSTPATRAAERALGGGSLAEELRGVAAAQPAPPPDPLPSEAAAVEMRRALTQQLRQTFTHFR